MGRFWVFVRKEFYHILRDKRTILILLIMPMVQILLFGFAISVELRNVDIAIVAPQRSESVRQIVDKIDANEYFTVKMMLDSPEQVERLMRRGEVDAAVVFGSDFQKTPSVQFVIDASNPNTAVMLSNYLRGIVSDYLTQDGVAPTVSVVSNGGAEANVRMLYNPQMRSAYNFVPGIMGLIFILICAMMTSVSIVREREMGTMEVLLVSPVKPIYIIFAKMIPYFTISCINLSTILLLAYFVLDVPVVGSIVSLCFVSLIYIALSLSLGLLISTLVQTQVAAMIGSAMGLMMPMIMLSGMIFPIESMPDVLQWVSNIIPARWYISATRKMMIEGLSLRYVTTEVTVLLSMCVVVIGIALAKFKNRLE